MYFRKAANVFLIYLGTEDLITLDYMSKCIRDLVLRNFNQIFGMSSGFCTGFCTNLMILFLVIILILKKTILS